MPPQAQADIDDGLVPIPSGPKTISASEAELTPVHPTESHPDPTEFHHKAKSFDFGPVKRAISGPRGVKAFFTDPLLPIGDFTRKQAEKMPDDPSRWIVNTIEDLGVVSADVVQGLSTPANLALLGAMAGGQGEAALPLLARMGFTAQAAEQATKAVSDGLREAKKGRLREAGRLWGGAGAQVLLAALANRGKSEKWQKAEVLPKIEEPPPEPVTVEGKLVNPELKAGVMPRLGTQRGAVKPNPPEPDWTRTHKLESVPSPKGLPSAERPILDTGKSTGSGLATRPRSELARVVAREEELEPANTEKTHEKIATQAPASTNATAPEAEGPQVGSEKPSPEVSLQPPPLAQGIVELPVKDIRTNPDKFQFKRDVGEGGVSGKLKKATSFDPFAAGVVSVWKEPATGVDYVVNGHHRLDHARRMGVDTIASRYIPVDTPEAAMVAGALQNIREGQGTAVDAAKVFRMLPEKPEVVAKEVGLTDKKIDEAVSLAKLTDPIWQQVYRGHVDPKVGIAIGELVSDPEAQWAALKMIESKGGEKLGDDEIRYAIRFAASSPLITETEGDLFGNHNVTRSLAFEKAKLASWIDRSLGSEKSIFSAVSRGASRIKQRGVGEVSEEQAKTVARNAAQAQAVFGKLADKSGAIGDALNAAAEKLDKGEHVNEVREELYKEVIKAISEIIGGGKQEGAPVLEKPPEANLFSTQLEPPPK